MRTAALLAVLGVISFIVGATSNDDRSWTWPFTWIGIVLIIAAIVVAVRGQRGRRAIP